MQVFRFYPDGTVLDVLVRPAPRTENAATIATWLRRELRARTRHATSSTGSASRSPREAT
ncbi:hypothetical protein ABZ557_03620 [Streptomyces sp. NPDC019645]|uniref:hypothetical protein n=1 Tax=Streptomyces sp. NPDC019645 TaxID=3154786 RepID=UPI0033D67439